MTEQRIEEESDWRTTSGLRARKRHHVNPPSNEGAFKAWRNRLHNLSISTLQTGRVHTSNGVSHVGAGVSNRKR